MIIDAHLHLPVVAHDLALGAAKAKLLSDMAICGLDYAIVIPDNIPDSPIGDLETCLTLLSGTPELFLLGTIDVRTQGQEAVDRLHELLGCRSIRGVKLYPGHDPVYPTDERLLPIYDLCEDTGCPS